MKFRLAKQYLMILLVITAAGSVFVYLEKKQYSFTLDSSKDLNPQTISLLKKLSGDNAVNIEVYSQRNTVVAKKISQFLRRIQKVNSQIGFEFVDPATNPDKVRQNVITMQGEMVVTFKNKEKLKKINIMELSEASIANAFLRLITDDAKWIVFAEGYGMSSVNDESPSGLTELLVFLKKSGFSVARMSLTPELALPENIRLIILPAPIQRLESTMVDWLQKQMESGISMWWLTDTFVKNQDNLELTLDVLVGDTFKISADKTTGVISSFVKHPLTEGFNQPLYIADAREVSSQTLQKLFPDTNQAAIAVAGEIENSRVIVTGDVDFINNRYINLAANKSMIMRITDWLLHNDNRINLPVKVNISTQLYLSQTQLLVMSVFLLMILPIVFLFISWRKWRAARD